MIYPQFNGLESGLISGKIDGQNTVKESTVGNIKLNILSIVATYHHYNGSMGTVYLFHIPVCIDLRLWFDSTHFL